MTRRQKTDQAFDPDDRLRKAAEAFVALDRFTYEPWRRMIESDEFRAIDRFGEILAAARADPVIAKSTHIKMLVEYLADVAENRWRELLAGDGVGALREVVNEHRREVAARPRAGVTREQLLAHRDQFVARHGHKRGWQASAQAEFGISAKVIRNRIAD